MTNTEYRKWTPEEVALLKDRATSSTVQELAQELAQDSVRVHAGP